MLHFACLVLRSMNSDYQQCLTTCKHLRERSAQFDVTSQSALTAMSLTTDRLLYSCAIEMVCDVRRFIYKLANCELQLGQYRIKRGKGEGVVAAAPGPAISGDLRLVGVENCCVLNVTETCKSWALARLGCIQCP